LISLLGIHIAEEPIHVELENVDYSSKQKDFKPFGEFY
jgi:hypothetical protein